MKLLYIGVILAQSFTHPAPGQYDPYVNMHNNLGMLCCNKSDCRRALPESIFHPNADGSFTVKANREGIPEGTIIDKGHVVPFDQSPDSDWHICMTGTWNGSRWDPRGGTVRCLAIPGGGV